MAIIIPLSERVLLQLKFQKVSEQDHTGSLLLNC